MNTKMNIVQDFDKIYIEKLKKFEFMVIDFNGNFEAEMIANGSFVLKKNKLFFINLNFDNTNILFNYSGDFTIKKAYIYREKTLKYVNIKYKSDNVDTIKSIWNLSTSKYTDFYRTNKGKPYRQTILRKRK
tara:strand:- start:12 stop:404 length:393 start_codon:yes stop_codon:yes gene_type:complete